MHPHWRPYPANAYPSGYDHPTELGHRAPSAPDMQPLVHMFASLESRLDQIIRLMEENNQLLRSIEQQQNRVVTSGSGSVIVRM
ncbi:hypothetical protein [Paenibacillus sp. MMS18-CY102]|uniref:hypothetical protein n=1 Tax=Paenibacillus sp. MMS18-CY102 TaxID=2682849 RepID=UPI0013AE4E5C|nr:hypothetical protein [Paenibacillus sp. MMS18-CY102]MWC28010.1 hypothetical protein [Paenibacillus sp. MMS18-CY102]